MAVMKTHISWTNSTWNPTVGCTKVSEGCRNCYAEALVNRLWGGGFDKIKLHPKRLSQVNGFRPLKDDSGSLRPRLVFVNSMSDLLHEDIPDGFRDEVFTAMDGRPDTIFQVLTKRPMSLRHFIERRYKQKGVPSHIWLGVSVEDNRVKGRINMIRGLKDAVGDFTAFLSVEPLIGAVDKHDYTNINWVLIGGESGRNCRPMKIEWALQSRDEARRCNAAVWFKQFGHPRNNPLVAKRMKDLGIGIRQAFDEVCQLGIEREPDEKGGATLEGEVLHELPPAFYSIKDRLNGGPKLL